MFGFGTQELGIILFGLFVVVLPAVLWFVALVDILRSEFTGSNKVIWILMVVLLPVVGFILYFIIGRKQRVLAVAESKPGTLPSWVKTREDYEKWKSGQES